ncbi:MAG: peptide ABC transporter permease [Candidatus Rokubacteria bacterium 13_2_20CM_69_15_1]|nr:MAG: peptide ABC transporter permease [Candidatus Rokubacteria bacterium 13_2_20CM_69_15_1]
MGTAVGAVRGAVAAEGRGPTPAGAAWRRLVASPVARAGLVLVGAFVLLAVVTPAVHDYDAKTDANLVARLKPPTAAHPFGTDTLGRDVLVRLLHATRVSLGLAVSSVAVAAVVGSTLGFLAGYLRRRFDLILMFCMDILLAFPATLLAIAVVAMIGPGLRNALFAISLVSIPVYARLSRSAVLALREQDFVIAARSLGGSGRRVLLGHIVPNSLPPLIVQTSLSIAFAILEAAALGFLGLGAQPPTPEWGAMLADSYKYFTSGAWWVFFFPGAAIMLSVLGFNLLGDALRDALDPRLGRE